MDNHAIMSFQDVIAYTGAQHLNGAPNILIKGVSTDSRTVRIGELFIALSGTRYNGDQFAQEAIEKGAAAVLVSSPLPRIQTKKLGVGVVQDGLKALRDLAKAYRRKLDIPFIAITGSSGKTTTKDMLYSILNDQFPVFKTYQNYNNHIGVCLSILQIRHQHKAACMETGTNAPGEIDSLASLVKPDIGIILNVGAAHLEKLRDIDGVCREKVDLLRHAKIGIYNKDDLLLHHCLSKKSSKLKTFGIYQGGDVCASGIEIRDNCSTQFNLFMGQEECGRICLPVPGIHQVYNALAAICAADLLGIDRVLMMESCRRFQLPKMRMEIKKEKGIIVINDTYNANPQSMKAALEVLKNLKLEGRRFFVCADMLELGESAQEQHRLLGHRVCDYGIYCLITYGHHTLQTSLICESKTNSTLKRVHHASDKDWIKSFLIDTLQPGDAVLIKGSRAMGMDEVADKVLEKLRNTQDYHALNDYTNVG